MNWITMGCEMVNGKRIQVGLPVKIKLPKLFITIYLTLSICLSISVLKLSQKVDLTVYTPACLPKLNADFTG